MSTPYLVRKATLDDIPGISALRIAYLREEFSEVADSDPRWAEIAAQLPPFFSEHLEQDCFVFTAEHSETNELIALVILSTSEKPANLSFPSGKSGVVLSVYTKPEYRGLGCATKLMRCLLEQAQTLGLSVVNLSASKMGKPIYEKLGFSVSESKFTEMEYIVPKNE